MNTIDMDEIVEFLRSDDFARAVRGSDNYYLLITRNYLPNLPYSVDEIFEISGEKNKKSDQSTRGRKEFTIIFLRENFPFCRK